MGGRDAQRGFILQSIIAMIECLDRDDWDEVKVEPDTALDKVDIQLYCDGKIKSAIQVKSSINKFGLPKVKGWLDELEKDAPDAEEVLLYLVGDSFTEDCEKYIGQNSDKIKKISFNYLKDICMGKIHGYVKKACPGEDVRIKDLDQIEANLFTGIHGNSIAQERLTRDAFEKAFCSVLAVSLYDRLMSTFANERKGHPSIRMMEDLDPNLFPKGLPEIKSENRYAVVGKESPRAIKDMILDSWKRDDKRHILLVGEGGIGKTVAMLTLPEEEWFRLYRIPVIYVPLQRLDAYEGRLNEYLREKFGADYDRIIELANRETEGHPRLLLLLDGFNEIPDRYKATAEKFIRGWMGRAGVQIITTSRLGFTLENSFLKYQLQTLPKETVESFLLSAGMRKEQLPKENDRIWEVINVPLMLTLYTQTDKVKGIADRSSVASLLDWREADNAAHIIWNYLQTELYRCIDKAGTSYSPMQYVTAILLVAPYVCCQMSRKMKFYINQEELQGLIREAMSFYGGRQNIVSRQFLNLQEEYDPYLEESFFEEKMASEYTHILVDNIALFQKQKSSDEKGRIKNTYSLMHQNFRDALAAFFISLCLPRTSESSEKTMLLDYADYYVKNYIAEFLSYNELINIWEKHRNEEPMDGHITWILMDIIGLQQGYNYSGVDFSGMDLTDISLYSALDFQPGLPRERGAFNNTMISNNTFIPMGHSGGINCIALSSDGNTLVSGSFDKTIRVWSLEDEKCIHVLKGHTGPIKAVAISGDTNWVVSGSDDKTLRLWDYSNELPIREFVGHTKSVSTVVISCDGKTILSGSSDSTIRVWDADKNDSVYVFGEHKHRITTISIDEDKAIAVSGDAGGSVYIWSYKERERRVINHIRCGDGRIIGAYLLHDKKQLIIGTSSGCIQIWDYSIDECKYIGKVPHDLNGSLICMKISGDEKHVVLGTYHWNAYLIDINTGHLEQEFGRHTDRVSAVLISQDSNQLISSSWDKTIRIWNMNTSECVKTLGRQTNCVSSVSMSADGHFVATGFRNGAVSIWNAETGVCEKYYRSDRGTILSVSIDEHGNYVVSGSWRGSVNIRNIATGEYRTLNYLPLERNGLPENSIGAVSISANGLYTISGNRDGTVCLWDTSTGEKVNSFEGHRAKVKSISINATGSNAASLDWNGALFIWDFHNKNNRVMMEDKKLTSVSIDRDGKLIAAGLYKNKILLLDSETGDCIREFGNSKQHVGRVTSVSLSADGKTIVSGSRDKTLCVWDTNTGYRKFPPKYHKGRIVSVSISADGKYAVSGDADNCVRIWDIDNNKCIREIYPFVDFHLIGVDMRGAEFVSTQIKEQCRQNGAIVD